MELSTKRRCRVIAQTSLQTTHASACCSRFPESSPRPSARTTSGSLSHRGISSLTPDLHAITTPLQHTCKICSGPRQHRSNACRAGLHHSCDLAVAEALDISQPQQVALLWFQTIEYLPDVPGFIERVPTRCTLLLIWQWLHVMRPSMIANQVCRDSVQVVPAPHVVHAGRQIGL